MSVQTPFASAPKDGSEILVVDTIIGCIQRGRFVDGRWHLGRAEAYWSPPDANGDIFWCRVPAEIDDKQTNTTGDEG